MEIELTGAAVDLYEKLKKGMTYDYVVHYSIATAMKVDDPLEVYDAVREFLDDTKGHWRLDEGTTIDCKKGCAFCCHLNVDVFDFEFEAIKTYLKNKYSRRIMKDVRIRAKSKYKKTRNMSSQKRQKQRIACPLLDPYTNSCMVYHARPLKCRTFFSADVRLCEKGFKKPNEDTENSFWAMPYILGQDIEIGLTIGMVQKSGNVNYDCIEAKLSEL